MASESTENYLATVYRLTRDGTQARTKDIAGALGLSAPSVSEMLARLAEQGYLHHRWRQGVTLTDQGKQVALQVLRKHRLIETFLVDVLGYGLDEVDADACRLEHAVSDRMADAMEAFLGNPAVDPHGHPIPARDGSVEEPALRSLAEVPPGQTVIVGQVDDDDAERLRYVAELGMVPGAAIEVLEVAPFDGPVMVRIGERQAALGRSVAGSVGVICDEGTP